MTNDRIIEKALKILEERARYDCDVLNSPSAVRDFLRLRIGGLEREEFWAVWLDTQNRVIEFESMFVGSLRETSVYPREVVKSALKHNASSVIFAHNHPSGVADPSRADELITVALKAALKMVDVRVLDHFVVALTEVTSMAERGLI